jgi:hypothetical protein
MVDLETAKRRELQEAVEEAEQDIAEGSWVEGSEVVEKLKTMIEPGSCGSGIQEEI